MGLTVLRIPLGLKTLLQILHKPLKFLPIQARYTFLLYLPILLLSVGSRCDQRDNPVKQFQDLNLIVLLEKLFPW